MEQRRKLIHVTTIPIRWGDMDAYGHVNNTVYFRFMEQGVSSGSSRCRCRFVLVVTGR